MSVDSIPRLDPDALRDTLDIAMAIGVGGLRFQAEIRLHLDPAATTARGGPR